jgi:hypothetical protein
MNNRCPKCHRFGIEYNYGTKHETCIWSDCLFINEKDIDLNKVKHPILYKKFAKAIKNAK